MPSAADLGAKLTSERQEFGKWMTDHKAADGSFDLDGDNLAEYNRRNDALAKMIAAHTLQQKAEKDVADNEAALAPSGRLVKDGAEPDLKDVKASGRLETKEHFDAAFTKAFAEHQPVLDAIAKGGRGSVSFDLKTDLKTTILTTVHAPQANRQQDTPSALYFGDTEGRFPHGAATSKSIDYFIQTTDTDNAAAVAEVTAPTDSAFAWTLVTDPIETVSTWIPMSHESIADNVGLQSTVTGMLARRLQKKSNALILAGDGNTPNPTGVFIRTGFQTQAKGADPVFDAVFKAMTKVEVTGDSVVDNIFFHPTDWQNIRLTRTTDGIYILGNPADGAPLNLWGTPVTKTTGIAAAGTAGVVDSSYMEIIEREGLTVEISTEHSTFFTERKVAILLYRRFAVADYRPSAAATVTGL